VLFAYGNFQHFLHVTNANYVRSGINNSDFKLIQDFIWKQILMQEYFFLFFGIKIGILLESKPLFS
jgi:hypothetical protein